MRKALALVLVQVAVILTWAGAHERIRATAPTFRVPLQPVDPFDMVRGRYFRLNPVDSWITVGGENAVLDADAVEHFLAAAGGERRFDGRAQVGFCLVADETHRVCALAPRGQEAWAPGVEHWSPARVSLWWSDSGRREDVAEPHWQVRIDLHIDRYFLPNRLSLPASENAEGWQLEVSWRRGQPLLPRRLLFRDDPVS
jgi:hypothetical protein